MARLSEKYKNEIIPKLQEDLGIKNVMSVPKLEKIIVSMGVGQAIQDSKRLDEAVQHMSQITGQKPQITRARRSIAAFKLREGMQIGCRVTLRSKRMYEFLDRLISLALPRVRDFRGLKRNAFDGSGNYSLGLTEQLVFPEINADKMHYVQGMNITFVTTAKTNDHGRQLLTEFGMPFQRDSAA